MDQKALTFSSSGLAGFALASLRDAVETFRHLAVVMVPVLVGVKLLQEAGLVEPLAAPLAPVTSLVGLPASMGLVWATAMLNNIYTAMVVFVTIAAVEPVTQAQVTVLATMILVAHNLPVELGIAKRAGTGIIFQLLVRVGGAVGLGFLLHHLYQGLGLLQDPARLLWKPAQQSGDPSLAAWAGGQVVSLGAIFAIILVLVTVMRILEKLRVTERVVGLLKPVLHWLGLGRTAAPLTIVGLIMGIAYGGGLIIKESRSGTVRPRDCFMAMTLLGMTHSVVEDTLLMVALGAHLSGILWARVLFSLLAVFLLSRMLTVLPGRLAAMLLYKNRPIPADPQSASPTKHP
ncbi:MAG: nucleoside recognition domain-containing protein [Desulfohalobiaceae bacterium]